MERILPQVTEVPAKPAHPTSLTQAVSMDVASGDVLAHATDIAAVWHATVQACGAQSLWVLVIAVVGLAGVPILADLWRGVIIHEPCTQLLGSSCGLAGALDLFRAVQVGADTATRGMIAFVILRRPAGDAWTVVLRRWPALLAGCLVYAALLTSAQQLVPASAQTWLHNSDKPAPWHGASLRDTEFDSISRALLKDTVQMFLPTPGIPIADLIEQPTASMGDASIPRVCTDADSIRPQVNLDRLAEYIASHCTTTAAPFDGLLLIVGAALVIATETLLRFRVVATFAINEVPEKGGLLRPVRTSVRLGWRHFGLVTAHVWVLRLAAVTFQIVFCMLPLLVVQQFVLPRVLPYISGGTAGAPFLIAVMAAGTAAVNGLLAAFGIVYDAQLFATLQ